MNTAGLSDSGADNRAGCRRIGEHPSLSPGPDRALAFAENARQFRFIELSPATAPLDLASFGLFRCHAGMKRPIATVVVTLRMSILLVTRTAQKRTNNRQKNGDADRRLRRNYGFLIRRSEVGVLLGADPLPS